MRHWCQGTIITSESACLSIRYAKTTPLGVIQEKLMVDPVKLGDQAYLKVWLYANIERRVGYGGKQLLKCTSNVGQLSELCCHSKVEKADSTLSTTDASGAHLAELFPEALQNDSAHATVFTYNRNV